MSITYNTVSGDTFEIISRKKYGVSDKASLISSANPGLNEPLSEGLSIIIPNEPDSPQNIRQDAPAGNINETALLIDGERFKFWESISITRNSDTFDTIEVGAPFEASNKTFRNAFRPFMFKEMVVTIGGIPFFTGTMLPSAPVIDPRKKTISVSGYSLPGVLNDCTAPPSSYPIEFNDQGLIDISKKMSAPFGLSVEFQENQGAIFERVSCETGKKVLSFLTGLAQQRNLIISNTTLGKLLFWKSIESGEPKALLRQGSSPLTSVLPIFEKQQYYSHVTGIEPVFLGLSGSQYTVKNPHLTDKIRPFVFGVPDTQDADIKEAVQSKIGRMFGNFASYQASVSTIRDPAGELWEPNTIINLQMPDAMIYNPYDFTSRSIQFDFTSKSQTAVIELVIPGSLNGIIPEKLPWDE